LVVKDEKSGAAALGFVAGRAFEPAEPVIIDDRAEFPEDTDDNLKRLQAGAYSALVAALYDRARTRLLAAAALVGRDTPLVRAVRAGTAPNRPALARVYRRIAVQFRLSRAGTESEAGNEQGLTQWQMYFRSEALKLTANSRTLRLVLTAACLGDTAEGRVAELRLVDLLDERYGRLAAEQRPDPAPNSTETDWITELQESITRS
jgi:hypothetical protein